MSPSEKAKELIEKFHQNMYHDLGAGAVHYANKASKCALIAVDEIIELEVWHYPHNTPCGMDFWENVKKEIIKFL